MKKPLLAMLLVAALPLFARDSRKDLEVSLKFVPQEGVQAHSPDLQPAMLERTVAIHAEDARGGEDARAIGKGTNDDDLSFVIRGTTDVAGYLDVTLPQVATEWGLKTAADADRKLTVRVMRFNVDESNKALGSMYAAEVKLAYELSDKSGKKLAEGSASGSASRYGRARSADNCNEVLSDSLKEAFASTLSDPQLQAAWTSGKAVAGAGSSGSGSGSEPKESVEQRLKKLDELLKKGLITKKEYDEKRAEILKEL